MVVGAHKRTLQPPNHTPLYETGVVYVYMPVVANNTNSTTSNGVVWQEVMQLKADDAQAYQSFGRYDAIKEGV